MKGLQQPIALAVLFLGCLQFSTAQITDKGNFMIGASIGFSYASSNVEATEITNGETTTTRGTDTKASQLTVAPKIGYFLVPNLALGIGMEYTFNRTSEPVNPSDPGSELESDFDSDLLFGPFARYYLVIGEDKAFFFESTFGFGSSIDQSNVSGRDRISSNVFAIGVGPGFTIFSKDALGIEALVKYNFARSSFDRESDIIRQESLTWTNQVDLSIGLVFYFAKVQAAGTTTSPEPRPNDFYR